MFELLVRSKWSSEGITVEGPFHGDIEASLHGADHLCTQDYEGDLQEPTNFVVGLPHSPDCVLDRYTYAIESDFGKASSEVNRLQGSDRDAIALPRNQDIRESISATAGDEKEVRLCSALYRPLLATENEIGSICLNLQVNSEKRNTWTLLQAPRCHRSPPYESIEDLRVFLAQRSVERTGNEIRPEKGTTRRVPPEFVSDQ